MAYNKKELEKKSIEAITKYKLIWIEEVVSYLPCGKVTFYKYRLNESNPIKAAIEKNRTDLKVSLRQKWYQSDNATLQMGLMKLIGSEDEAARLSGSTQNLNISLEERTKKVNTLFPTDDELIEIEEERKQELPEATPGTNP